MKMFNGPLLLRQLWLAVMCCLLLLHDGHDSLVEAMESTVMSLHGTSSIRTRITEDRQMPVEYHRLAETNQFVKVNPTHRFSTKAAAFLQRSLSEHRSPKHDRVMFKEAYDAQMKTRVVNKQRLLDLEAQLEAGNILVLPRSTAPLETAIERAKENHLPATQRESHKMEVSGSNGNEEHPELTTRPEDKQRLLTLEAKMKLGEKISLPRSTVPIPIHAEEDAEANMMPVAHIVHKKEGVFARSEQHPGFQVQSTQKGDIAQQSGPTINMASAPHSSRAAIAMPGDTTSMEANRQSTTRTDKVTSTYTRADILQTEDNKVSAETESRSEDDPSTKGPLGRIELEDRETQNDVQEALVQADAEDGHGTELNTQSSGMVAQRTGLSRQGIERDQAFKFVMANDNTHFKTLPSSTEFLSAARFTTQQRSWKQRSNDHLAARPNFKLNPSQASQATSMSSNAAVSATAYQRNPYMSAGSAYPTAYSTSPPYGYPSYPSAYQPYNGPAQLYASYPAYSMFQEVAPRP